MFGENLKKIRENRKLSQTELVDRVNNILGTNYTYENIKSWEKGTNPKVEVISALAEALGVLEQDFFNGNEKQRINSIKNLLSNLNEHELNYVKNILGISGDIQVHHSPNTYIANGNISINTQNLAEDKEEIKEILELMEYAPKIFFRKLKADLVKLKKSTYEVIGASTMEAVR